ncbi:MAG: segregation and condensation protein A [Phycisphaeraceae bacterium]
MDYRIQLDAYAGPLDLLLHLVKRNEIDLHDIPIAELTEQYLAHLQLLEHLDMDQAGEFLVMAATLLEIKSQMIVPQPERDEDAEDEGEGEGEGQTEPDPTDPRYELVQQLLAYKRYKDAAHALERRQADWSARFAVRPIDRAKVEKDESEAEQREIELEDVNVFELCEAFGRLLSSIGEFTGHSVTDDDTPIGLHAEDIADRLTREGPLTLRRICEGRNRAEMIGLFLAMLELVRDKRVSVVQDESEMGRDVRLELRADSEAEAADNEKEADWRDPETGEVQYDWPDEGARRRFERRQQRRQRGFQKGDFTSDDENDDFDEDEDIEDEEDFEVGEDDDA